MPILYWAAVSLGLTLLTRRCMRETFEKPVQELAAATRKVAEGDFSIYVPPLHTADRYDYLDVMILDFNKMVAELGSVETLKTDFFANVSHEIKTPLAVIQNTAQLLKSRSLPPEQREEYVDTIEKYAHRLADLITNILKLNKLEKQTIQPRAEPYDLTAQLADCALLFESRWEEKGIDFEADFEDQAVIQADPSLLELVWNNLLSNAIKFTPPGGTVALRQTSTPDAIQVTVTDTGRGMSEETMQHMFDKFYQGDTSHAAEGNGLGLALVLRILQMTGGSISVESALGQGSKFTVTLPLEAVKTQTGGPAAAVRPQREQPFDWSGWKVLLAEDNELNMEIATEILTMCGAEVLSASNGAEVVHLFSAAAPYSIGVILMDMQMPEMDGCEAARIIRSMNRPDAQWVPIIAVTANAFAEDIDRTTKAGMNGHVSKPIDFHLLGQVLQKAIQERDGDAPASKG